MNAMLYILVGAALLSAGAYAFGYFTADQRNERIVRSMSSQLRLLRRQQDEMTSWVQTNWPNEYAAYVQGIDTGYQQGVLHAPAYLEEANE